MATRLRPKVSEKKLVEFLNEALEKSSYSANGAFESTLEDGTKKIGPFVKGNLAYLDRYKNGPEGFIGREEVTLNGKVVWKRSYNGRVVDKKHSAVEQLYDSLKAALREYPKSYPFSRGPAEFESGSYKYLNDYKGTLSEFSGTEMITFNGKLVYMLAYNGGNVG